VGASDVKLGSAATGFLVALVITLGAAAVLAYWRRGILSGAEISSYWLGCTLAVIWASRFLFEALGWNWVGGYAAQGSLATGSLLALVIALGAAAVLAYRREGTLSDAEISSYWLGCTLALISVSGVLFAAHSWNWVGSAIAYLGGLASGYVLALVIALGTAAVLAYRQRGTLSGADAARYWLGCTLALVIALGGPLRSPQVELGGRA